jgi:hypothetical protein
VNNRTGRGTGGSVRVFSIVCSLLVASTSAPALAGLIGQDTPAGIGQPDKVTPVVAGTPTHR